MEKIVRLYNEGKWGEILKQEAFLVDHGNSDQDNSLLILSESYANLNQFDKGIYYAKKLAAADPSNYYALLMLGNYYQVLKEFTTSEAYYYQVLKLKPTYARANLNLAFLYTAQHKKDKAIVQYLRAIELFSINNFKAEVQEYSLEVLKLDPNNKTAKKYLE